MQYNEIRILENPNGKFRIWAAFCFCARRWRLDHNCVGIQEKHILVTNNDSRSRSTIHSEGFQHSCLTAPPRSELPRPSAVHRQTSVVPMSVAESHFHRCFEFLPLLSGSVPRTHRSSRMRPVYCRGFWKPIRELASSSRPWWRPEATVRGPYRPASPGFREVWVIATHQAEATFHSP